MSSAGNQKYGVIHRYNPPRESTAAAVAIVLLTVIEVVFIGLFTFGLISGWGFSEFGNMFLGGLLAVIFIDLALILTLYRKEFLPDVMIVKKRRRKWEDLYIKEEDMDGVDSMGGVWESMKQTIYPYYKR